VHLFSSKHFLYASILTASRSAAEMIDWGQPRIGGFITRLTEHGSRRK